ncbi:putative bacteriophage tail tape measure protein [Psychrobacter arcticus 273-4]|uniref:Putative bacteriophage tail tape measure protein n=2 Tax=Psychrobacter arcticus TaxID=334543 RepID=Q4FSX5_PSYA2|nr:putative bacteriophage tail tape measure protein [Psychrobacter arcticus 273-4]
MSGDLDFNVQLRVLNEQFNNGINQARDKFTQYAQSVQRNVAQMNTDTERASTMLAGLNNISSDRLTAEIRATADQLRQMGAGANISGEQVESAMQASALQVIRLGRQLEVARSEAVRLSQTNTSPEDIELAAANVNRLEQELNGARSASVSLANELSGAMNRASTTADNARNALYRMANIRVPETIRGEIDSISRALVDFQNNSGRPAAEIERATRAAEEQIRRLENELNGVDDTIRRTDVSTGGLSSGVGKLKNAMSGLAGLLAAAGLSIGISEIIQTADAFILLEAKIKLATGEGANFVNGFNGVKQIAAETLSSVENTGELFARITQASEMLGLAQNDVLGITKTINQAIQLSGGSAASADAAITQLIQGLQSGVVRGEEFNSIMEQSPRLAKAMADGLGVTRGELRAMAQDGKLTSEVVINAVRSQGEAIGKEFETLPATVGNAVQTMKNTLFLFIGDINEVVNQSGKMAAGIDHISKAIKNIDPATMAALNLKFEQTVEMVSVLFTTIKDLYTGFSDLISIMDLTSKSGEKVGLITKFIQQASVAMGVMIDGVKGFSIIADSVFGTVSGIIGSVLIGIAKMNGETSTMGEELMRKQEELHARSEQKMMDFQSSTGKAWTEMNKTAQDRLNDTLKVATDNYDEMVAKGTISAEAMEEQYIKVALAKIAANNMIVSDDDRLDLAQKDLQATISDTGEVIIESAKGVQAAYLGVGESFAEVAIKAQVSGTSMRESLTDAVPKAQTIGAVDDIISSLSALGSQGKISGEDMAFGINMANERYKEIEENFARYAAKSIKDNNGIVTSELEKAAALQGLAVQATETGGVLVTQLDKSTLASTRTKDEIDKLAGAAGVGLSAGFMKSKEGLNELVDGYDDLEKAGYDAGGAVINALTEMSNKASNTAEIENLTITWNELYKEGKITGQELADGLEQVENRANILKDGINGVTEAYGFLGLKTREELGKDSKAHTDAYNIILEDGKATAEQIDEAFLKTAKSNIAANGGVIDAVTKRMAAERGVTVVLDEQKRVTVEKMGQSAKANDKVTTSVGRIKTAYDGIASSAGSAGNAMVQSANNAASAYDKLQQKIKDVKEAQAVSGGDETLKNLRVYGTEKAPAEGNQFGSKLAVENFFKSAGLSVERAAEEARKLYAKQGTADGTLNFGKLQGFKDGQVMTASDIEKFKSASVYLAEIASRARDDERQKSKYESSLNKIPDSALQAVSSLNKQPSFDTGSNTIGSKSYDVKFTLGGITANASVPESQAAVFERMMQELQASKAIAGY